VWPVAEAPGDRDRGEVDVCWVVRADWKVCTAVVVGPTARDFDVIARGFEGGDVTCVEDVAVWWEDCCDEDGEEACEMAEWTRKAARKFERNGRLVGMTILWLRIGIGSESCARLSPSR
jgi:hypothetical protein